MLHSALEKEMDETRWMVTQDLNEVRTERGIV